MTDSTKPIYIWLPDEKRIEMYFNALWTLFHRYHLLAVCLLILASAGGIKVKLDINQIAAIWLLGKTDEQPTVELAWTAASRYLNQHNKQGGK